MKNHSSKNHFSILRIFKFPTLLPIFIFGSFPVYAGVLALQREPGKDFCTFKPEGGYAIIVKPGQCVEIGKAPSIHVANPAACCG